MTESNPAGLYERGDWDGKGSPPSYQPKIQDARDLAVRWRLQAVVLITVARDGTVTVTSHGEDKPKCASIGDWAQELWKHGVAAVPFQTRFGWGHGGCPTPLSPVEFDSLSDAGKAYARQHGGEPSGRDRADQLVADAVERRASSELRALREESVCIDCVGQGGDAGSRFNPCPTCGKARAHG